MQRQENGEGENDELRSFIQKEFDKQSQLLGKKRFDLVGL